jgi:uncharacterized protein affecting Mg2+/Co2+ transport
MDVLPPDARQRVLSFLMPADVARFGAASRAAAADAADDAAWAPHVLADWGVAAPPAPGARGRGDGVAAAAAAAGGGPPPSARALWLSRLSAAGGPAIVRHGTARRVRAAWATIQGWLEAHLHVPRSSFLPPPSPDAVAAAEAALGHALPPAVRALYATTGGQAVALERDEAGDVYLADPALWKGAFGGVLFYDTAVSTRLLPLPAAVGLTAITRRAEASDLTGALRTAAARGRALAEGMSRDEAARTTRLFAFARSFDDYGHVVSVDAGAPEAPVLVRCRAVTGEPTAVRACPEGAGLVEWLEEHAARLAGGVYSPAVVPRALRAALRSIRGHRAVDGDDDSDATWSYLSLAPGAGPASSAAVTAGIHVHVGATIVPSRSVVPRDAEYVPAGKPPLPPPSRGARAAPPAWAWTYRVRMWNDGASAPAVTLATRRWVIRGADGGEEVVEGPGVIGEFPTLRAPPAGGGGPAAAFEYASATHSAPSADHAGGGGAAGTMGGAFTFVVGEDAPADGAIPPGAATVTAEVGRWAMARPAFMY